MKAHESSTRIHTGLMQTGLYVHTVIHTGLYTHRYTHSIYTYRYSARCVILNDAYTNCLKSVRRSFSMSAVFSARSRPNVAYCVTVVYKTKSHHDYEIISADT